MVPSSQMNALGVPNLKSNQIRNCLYRIVASIDEIAHKKIVSIWDISTNVE